MQPLSQGLALNQLRDEKAPSFVLLQPADRGDIGMIRRCQQLGFALETGQPFRVSSEDIGQDLDRYPQE